jgi:hypothetical protein
VGAWLEELLVILDITPPPGVEYMGHSLRGDAASAALSIGVSMPVICRWGIYWSRASPRYIGGTNNTACI